MSTAIGYALHNPLNIKRAMAMGAARDVDWRGLALIQSHATFCQFCEPVYGIRAAARILFNYSARLRICTVRGVVERWAPPEDDNPTSAYVQAVADRLGVRPDDWIDMSEVQTLSHLIQAMMIQEIGSMPYRRAQIEDGVRLALEL